MSVSTIGQVPPLQDRGHREFLGRLKQRVEALGTAAQQAQGSSAAISALRSELLGKFAELRQMIANIGSQPTVGTTLSGTAAADIVRLTLVRATPGGYAPASSTTAAHAGTIAGIALQDAQAGDDFNFASSGALVQDDGWLWTPGQTLWIGAAGALSTDAGSGAFVQPVAIATATDELLVLLCEPVLQQATGRLLQLGPTGRLETVDARYEHLQAAAASEWVINHNFGYRPAITCFTVGGVEFGAEIVHVSTNQARVLLAVPAAGSALCI